MKSKLLRPKKDSFWQDVVAVDVFVHESANPQVFADVRSALEQGLTPKAFSLVNDIVVLRLEREKS